MKPWLVATTLLIVLISATPAGAQEAVKDKANLPLQKPIQALAQKVKELKQERIAVLTELTDQLARLYQNGRVDEDAFLEARVQLLRAKLDAAEKQADRLALYKDLVEELKQFEKVAQGRMESGRGSKASVLKVKVRRLEAEIHLEETKAGKANQKPQKTTATSPQVKNVTITQRYACQIHAHHHIRVRALQTGVIESIPVHEGQTVKKGDLIFRTTPNVYKAKLDAEVAELTLAELELQNTEALFKKKVVTSQEVSLYKAKWERAKAKADLARAELNFTEVRAPFDGLIDRLQEQQGSNVKEGETVTTLSDNSLMWVYFNVPERRYLEYIMDGKGKEAKIELVLADRTKFKQSGKIGAIEAKFNNDISAIPFRADFPNPDRVLRHGMTGTILMHRTLNNAILIPQRATFEVVGNRYVYVIDKEGMAHRREIVVQSELDDFFVVQSGVSVDDRIIVEGTKQVQDGQRVDYDFRPPDAIPGHQKIHRE